MHPLLRRPALAQRVQKTETISCGVKKKVKKPQGLLVPSGRMCSVDGDEKGGRETVDVGSSWDRVVAALSIVIRAAYLNPEGEK